MAVNTEEFVVSAQPERLLRSFRNRPLSSAARCCASAALPPLPKNRILLPERRHLVIASATLTTVLKYVADPSRLCITDAQSRILATARDCALSAFIEHLPSRSRRQRLKNKSFNRSREPSRARTRLR